MVETPEGLNSEPISDEDKEKISSLVKEAVGFNVDRGDSIVVTSGDFIEKLRSLQQNGIKSSGFKI